MKLMHKACLILCFTVLLYGLSGCGRNQSEKKLLKDETRLLQEQLNKDTQDLNRRNKEYDEQQKQVDFARQKEEAEKKAELQKEIEEQGAGACGGCTQGLRYCHSGAKSAFQQITQRQFLL